MHYMILNSIINITERKINNYKNCNCIYYKYSIERLHACTIQFTFYNVKAFHTMFDFRFEKHTKKYGLKVSENRTAQSLVAT